MHVYVIIFPLYYVSSLYEIMGDVNGENCMKAFMTAGW